MFADTGATLRNGIKTLAKWGACREEVWKYSAANLFRKPSSAAYAEARNHTITSYLRLQNLDNMRECLAGGFPFAFSFAVYESFETAQVRRTGKMPMPKLGESMLGGHAVLAVGYDDPKKHLTVRNSWGREWGIEGYFTMPYSFASDKNLAGDFWAIRG